MKRTLEASFHRLSRLLILVILLPLVGLVVAYLLPRSYQTTAKFWAWHTLQSVSVASQGSSAANQEIDPQTNVPITPAQSQANALSQFLQTYDFVLAVAKGTALASTLGLDANTQANQQLRNEAIFQDISHHVQVVAQGHNLVSVSYINRDPRVSQQVVEAAIQHYALQSQSFVLIEGQKLLDPYQKQLAGALLNTDKVVRAEAQYRLGHPGLNGDGLLADSQYQSLHDQVQQEQALVTSIQSTMATLNQTISLNASPGGLFNVLDAPATQSISRTISFLIAGAIGLGTALLACIVYIFIAVRRDRAIYTAFDLQKVTAFPVVTQLSHLSPGAVSLLVNGSVQSDSKGR
jgi:hypothetical protein